MNIQRPKPDTIQLPGKNRSSPYGDGVSPEIDLPAADNASVEIPMEFPKKGSEAVETHA